MILKSRMLSRTARVAKRLLDGGGQPVGAQGFFGIDMRLLLRKPETVAYQLSVCLPTQRLDEQRRGAFARDETVRSSCS